MAAHHTVMHCLVLYTVRACTLARTDTGLYGSARRRSCNEQAGHWAQRACMLLRLRLRLRRRLATSSICPGNLTTR